ncbi:MAG: hypothetical protein HXY48_12895 [Ignavibacteriaceae bacterium]|nr:hypothetical protein [Ignavibacteriaceae bacterium]
MRKILLTLTSLFLLFFISCSDDPVTPQEDHFEAEGMVFYQSGIKIAEIFRGVTQDTLSIGAGVEGPHTDIKFYNSNKVEIDPPDYTKQPLAWEFADTTFAEIEQHAGEEGSYEFHLVGKVAGITTVEFFIMHEGHADFRSGKIPLKVQ